MRHTADVTAVFVNNQYSIQRRGQNFDKKFVFEGVHTKRLPDEFPEKSWTERSVNKLLKKLRDTGKRCHTTTGSCQSHPHFIEENNYAFVCLNISNIPLTHKYTQHTHSYMLRGIKIGALKMQSVCFFFHIC